MSHHSRLIPRTVRLRKFTLQLLLVPEKQHSPPHSIVKESARTKPSQSDPHLPPHLRSTSTYRASPSPGRPPNPASAPNNQPAAPMAARTAATGWTLDTFGGWPEQNPRVFLRNIERQMILCHIADDVAKAKLLMLCLEIDSPADKWFETLDAAVQVDWTQLRSRSGRERPRYAAASASDVGRTVTEPPNRAYRRATPTYCGVRNLAGA
jgi:hypothetical protein